MDKQYTSAKQVIDLNITDFTIVEEQSIDEYEDNILLLNLNCSSYRVAGHNLDSLPNKTDITLKNTTVPLLLWRNVLDYLYYSYINNKVMKSYVLSHQDQTLWNGKTEYPLGFINNYECKDDSFTIYRFYKNIVDFNSYTNEKMDPNGILMELNVSDKSIKYSDLPTTLEGIKVTQRIYNIMDLIEADVIGSLELVDASTSNLNFNVSLSRNDEKFTELTKGDQFKLRVPNRGKTVQLLMKNKFSNDINIIVKGHAKKVYNKDITVIEEFIGNGSGYLDIHNMEFEDNETYRVKVISNGYEGKLIDKKSFGLTNISRIEDPFRDNSNQTPLINGIENRNGSIYIYVPGYDYFRTKDNDISLELTVRKFYRRVSRNIVEEVNSNIQIDYNTPREFDIATRRYTYTIDITEEMDNIENPEFTLTPQARESNILSIEVKDNKLIIVSDTDLCTKYTIPRCTLRLTGTHTYITHENLFKDNYKIFILFNEEFDEEDLRTDGRKGPYVKYEFDPDFSDMYTDEEEVKAIYYFTYKQEVEPSERRELLSYILIKDYEIVDNEFIVYIDRDSYDKQGHNRFDLQYNMSLPYIYFKYDYKSPVLYKDQEYSDWEEINISMNHNNIYKIANTYTINGSTYYAYNFNMSYEFLPINDALLDIDVSYALESNRDIVHDIWYDVHNDKGYYNGTISIYFMREGKEYDYTIIKVSFFIGSEIYQVNQEVYETYRFSGKALEKIKKLIRLSHITNQGLAMYPKDKIFEINEL